MTAFEEFGMMPELIQAMEDMEWFLPKPVQQESIPLILGGGDVMCAAETGSGKTGAFCLPIIQTTWEVLNSKINPDKKKQALSYCRINRDDCNEFLKSSEDGIQCMANHPTFWGGGRANYGVLNGKYFYEVTVVGDTNLVRVGWSTIEADRDLGTDRMGFGFGGTGKKSFARQFDAYGREYKKGDTVGCLLDRAENKIQFMINGVNLGDAFNPIPSALKEEALYPSFSVKQSHLAFNFGQRPWKFPPPTGYLAVNSLRETIAEQEKLYERFMRIKEKVESGQGHLPTALIIEPTLELAQQIADEIQKFVKYIDNPVMRYAVIVGKKEMKEIMKELNDGADIVVGTPGKLVGMLEAKQLNLSKIKFFVLDEADRLSTDNLDIILKLYNAIMQGQKERVQVCMFSATLHSPEITNLHQQICPKASWVDLKGRDYVPDTVHHGVVFVNPNDPNLKQASVQDYQDDRIHDRDNRSDKSFMQSLAIKRMKPEMVARLIDAYQMEQCLIFCRTRLDCDNMKDFLDKKGGGRKFSGKAEKGKENPYSNVCLHSGYKPAERRENLEMFKDGDVRLLICTDVAARGIDIKELPYVINVTLPDKDEDYVHRVGRVGRADRMGLAVSLVAKEKEKVWYHTCASRGEGCSNTALTENGGCAIWYDEPLFLNRIQERIGELIPEMGKDFRHPAHRNIPVGEKVIYGKTRAEANQGVSEHIQSILTDVAQLAEVEHQSQNTYLGLPGIVSNIVGTTTDPKVPRPFEAYRKAAANRGK